MWCHSAKQRGRRAPTQPASGQRLVASLCSQQTAVSSLPTSCLPSKQIACASHPFPARDCPRAKLWSNRRSCALKRRTYLQLLALKSLQPWPQLWPIAQSCYSRRPLAGLKQTRRACVVPSARNFGFKPVLQLSRGKRFCDSARSSCSARLALARKSLQPSLELSSAACPRRNCHSQPSTPRRPARASRSCDTRAHFSLGCGVNRPSNVAAARDSRSSSRRRLRMQTSSVCAFARSSASRITRPAGVQIKTLNPKRFVSGRYWGGLKQPPRRAAPRPSLGRGAPLPRANPKP